MMANWTFLVIGWYLLVWILIYLFVPRPPRAAEAFRIAEEAHPVGKLLSTILVATFWPLVMMGVVLRLFRRLFRRK